MRLLLIKKSIDKPESMSHGFFLFIYIIFIHGFADRGDMCGANKENEMKWRG